MSITTLATASTVSWFAQDTKEDLPQNSCAGITDEVFWYRDEMKLHELKLADTLTVLYDPNVQILTVYTETGGIFCYLPRDQVDIFISKLSTYCKIPPVIVAERKEEVELETLDKQCSRCGWTSHNINNCYAKKHRTGQVLLEVG